MKQKLSAALDGFLARLQKDKTILAAVQVGSFADEVLWRKETIHLWVIEEDGVSKRLKSDGDEPRIFRTLVEEDVNIHAELIPRSKFKLMVEGSSRTAFSCSFFAKRILVYCADPSIKTWFTTADALAVKDQKRELLAAATWVMHSTHCARKIVEHQRPPHELHQTLMWAAHGLAALEVIARGEICEGELLERALALNPKLFKVVYADVIDAGADAKVMKKALERIEKLQDEKWGTWLEPLLAYLKKQGRVVRLTEIAEHFAHTQLWPGHLECACEWLARHGHVEKLTEPFLLTRRSRIEVEEPAYLLES